MSNHWGGQLLNDALNLAEAHGFFEGHSPEKVRTLLVDLVNLAVDRHDCNPDEILGQIGPRHGLCYYCLEAASNFTQEGYCSNCDAELDGTEVEDTSDFLSVSLDRWIPFDNLSPEQQIQRADMQSRLRKFRPLRGDLLVARYSGPKHPKSDAENLLLYNIGNKCFASAFKNGVQFEELSRPTSLSEYNYHLADSAQIQGPSSWVRAARLATLTGLTIPAPSNRWASQVWHRLRTTRGTSDNVHQGPFEIVLNLRSPAGVKPKISPDKLKKLLDGVVSAYQWQNLDEQLAETCERLSRLIGQPAPHLRELLRDPAGAVLGSPGQLLRVYREGIKWNPGDHLCVSGTVRWSQGEGADWTVSGEIWSLKAVVEL